MLCTMLKVSRSGYYRWVNAGRPTSKAKDDTELDEVVAQIHRQARGTYGSPRIYRELVERGIRVSKRRVERVMRKLGLVGRTPKEFRRTTVREPLHPVADNLLNRRFTADRPNEVWVGDITYVRTRAGWVYVAVLIDLYSRGVVGWAVHDTLHTDLALEALEMAVKRRRPPPGLLHHTDRGCQYTSQRYQRRLQALSICPSMSRKGDCWDNAVAESFFSTLKRELLYGCRWNNREDVSFAIFDYVETFYNPHRRHSTLGYQSPTTIEQHYNAVNAA